MLLLCAPGAVSFAGLASASSEVVVVIDLENICHSPDANPREKYGAAVKVWMKDIPPPSLVCSVLAS